MTSCGDLFQKRQRLLRERADVEADLKRVKTLQASQVPDDPWKEEIGGKFGDEIDKLEQSGEIDDLIQETLDKSKPNPQVNIPGGQPTNIAQMIRYYPEEFVKDQALMSKALMNRGQELSPEQWEFIQDNPGVAAQHVSELITGKMNAEEVLGMMNRDAVGFNSVVEKTMRLRAIYQVSKKALLDVFDDLENFTTNNTKATQFPSDLLRKTVATYKIALMSERQYDFVRNSWSKQGKAMQGAGFNDLEVDFVSGKLEENIDNSMDIPTVQEARDMKPEDFSEDSPIGRILAAADTFRTNRDAGLKQLELEINTARIRGFDPAKIYDPKNYVDRMHRLTNVLAKDSQLWNLRTQGLNAGSNFIMGLFGPARKLHEGVAYRPVGTSLMDSYYENFQAGLKGYGQAVKMLRESGKEVFLDAWNNKSMHYAGQIDTYGKYFKSTEQQIQELKMLRDWRPKTKRSKQLMAANPVWWRRWAHATSRLWLYEKLKHPYFLRPGLTNLTAVDNLAGFFFHNYHLRTDLELRARRDGVQLGLIDKDGNLDRMKMDDWINKQFDEASYSHQVTEKMRLQYRQENGLTPDIVDDVEIENMIREEKIGETYGAPVVDNEFVRDAGRFSEDMRFQTKPGKRNPGKPLYNTIDNLRKDFWMADVMFPYLQAPFKGNSLDFTLTGMGPLLDFLRISFNRSDAWTPKEIARVKSNAAMAGFVWATYGMLSASDQIVGNGPPPGAEREEWLTQLKLDGKRPNSIGGVPMVGGLPVISTMFLLKDVEDAIKRGNVSKYDTQGVLNGIFAVLVGHLTRHTAVGNVKQIMDIAYGDDYGQRRPGKYLGYMASGQLNPLIGPLRETERLIGAKASQVYRPRPFTEEEKEMFDEFKFRDFEDGLRDRVMNMFSIASVAGGKFKNYDWLGSKTRLSWGEHFGRYLKYKYFPGQHPEGEKVYAELNRLNLLNPPGPLLNKTLEGVPMSDDLQEMYNNTYFQNKGNEGMLMILKEASRNPTYRFDPIVFSVINQGGGKLSGQRFIKRVSDSSGGKVFELDVPLFLVKHVSNKTPIQAFRSVMNDPFYKKLMEQKSTTADLRVQDKTKRELKRTIPYKMMETVKEYFHLLTVNSINVSQEPEAIQWRAMRDSIESANTAKDAAQNEGIMEALEVFRGK